MSERELRRSVVVPDRASWWRRHATALAAAGALIGAGAASAVALRAPAGAAAHVGATPTSSAPGELARDTVQDTVQIALLLDTSSSMDGLINQARAQLWSMVDQMGRATRVVDGKLRTVKLELALYEYGNDRLSAKDGYIRQVLPFSRDLDLVSDKLQGLSTMGGSEFVPEVIETAAAQLQWTTDPDALKFVFVAGNETFDQGPIGAADAMAAAAKKDIHVQLILCGEREPSWTAAAQLAHSDLMTIDQDQVARQVAAPQDAQILQLNAQLNDTYLAYGAAGGEAMARQQRADAASGKLGANAALARVQVKSKAAYKNDNWDVVDKVADDRKFLESAKDEELPAAMRGKSLAEKQQIVDAKAAERASIQAQIRKLEAERGAYLAAEQAKAGAAGAAAAPAMLDSQVMKAAKPIAAKKGYRF